MASGLKVNLTPKKIAGMSMTGGRKDNFFFCLLEYFPDDNRWFLKSLLQVKDEEGMVGNEAVHAWIEEYGIGQLILDFPQSQPACQTCALSCPGEKQCPDLAVREIRRRVDLLLLEDREIHKNNPKQYERNRKIDDEVNFTKDDLGKKSDEHLLTRSFKRKLKRGYLPYWNRPIDLWVWQNYFDQTLELFKGTYDSFGDSSMMTLFRFHYLKRHFPHRLNLSEGNVSIILIELLKSKILLKKDLLGMNDLQGGVTFRLDIIKKIESKLNLFIYEHDLEIIVKNPRAFNSFLLALAGKNIVMDQHQELPSWTLPDQTQFVVPKFF